MKVVLVYISPNGSTAAVAGLLGNLITKEGHELLAIDIGSGDFRRRPELARAALEGADIVGFGSPVMHMDILEPLARIIRPLPEGGSGFKAFLFLTYGGITSGRAFSNAAGLFRKAGIPFCGGFLVEAPHLHHREAFPRAETEKTAAFFWNNLAAKGFAAFAETEKKAFRPYKLLTALAYPLASSIGESRELAISIDTGKCRACGKCARECPAAAIEVGKTAMRDGKACIHCYHCAIACPLGAIGCDLGKLDSFIALNKRIIGTESPANRCILAGLHRGH